MTQVVALKTEYITLGQLLKEINVISSGGMAKWYLKEYAVLVDDEPEDRRGRKLYAGMKIEVPNEGIFILKNENPEATTGASEE